MNRPATAPRARVARRPHPASWMLALPLLLAGLLLAQGALASHPHGQPASQAPATALSPAQLRATLAAMPQGDPQRGGRLHQARMCASCHGDDGAAPTGNWASLAGQKAAYTYKSLLDYQTGRRLEHGRANLMRVAVQGLSRQDMADLAAWYATLPAVASPLPPTYPPVSPQARVQAEWLVRKGDPARLLTPCASCHGARGQGGVNASPALAGQTVGAFTRTLLDYREGRRATDAHQGMGQFAQRLTLEEIHALAAYYAGQGKTLETRK
ncbi:MAG: c-type cytochrome [Pseudomonadota bacterium]